MGTGLSVAEIEAVTSGERTTASYLLFDVAAGGLKKSFTDPAPAPSPIASIRSKFRVGAE